LGRLDPTGGGQYLSSDSRLVRGNTTCSIDDKSQCDADGEIDRPNSFDSEKTANAMHYQPNLERSKQGKDQLTEEPVMETGLWAYGKADLAATQSALNKSHQSASGLLDALQIMISIPSV